jgi:hypothetical protein
VMSPFQWMPPSKKMCSRLGYVANFGQEVVKGQ